MLKICKHISRIHFLFLSTKLSLQNENANLGLVYAFILTAFLHLKKANDYCTSILLTAYLQRAEKPFLGLIWSS